MSDNLFIVLVATMVILGGLVNVWLTARQSKRNKIKDDKIAGHVEEVAAAAKETSNNAKHQLSEIKDVVDNTHLLVNSNMMKEMRRGLVSLRAQLALQEKSIARDEKEGLESDLSIIEDLKAEIKSQEISLAELQERTK